VVGTVRVLYTHLLITFHNNPMRSALFNPFPAQEVGEQRGLGSCYCRIQTKAPGSHHIQGEALIFCLIASG